MGSGSSINAYFGFVAIVSGIRYCITQRRKGREKDNFLLFFFAALRLCVIKLRDKKCARRVRGASPCNHLLLTVFVG